MSTAHRLTAVACLALALAGCSLPSRSASVEDCVTGFTEGFGAQLTAEYARHIAVEDVARVARDLCTELVQRPGIESADEAELRAATVEVLRTRPALYRPLCSAMVEADIAASRPLLGYVTKKELRRYRTTFCEIVPGYLRADGPPVDTPALVRDHPELVVPFCASGMQTELARSRRFTAKLTDAELRTITRLTCAEALATAAIDVSGPRGLFDAALDERAIGEIFLRHVERVTAR